jgi:hypothetical protein
MKDLPAVNGVTRLYMSERFSLLLQPLRSLDSLNPQQHRPRCSTSSCWKLFAGWISKLASED